jgi:hypothetical protein
MNIQIQLESAALNPCVFRAADRMRIDGCANAVAHEGLSLALYCPYEALLDHYVNLLLGQLRQQAPDHRIEVYFPANTDSLLDRFNEVLASQSLNQAVKTPSNSNQAQIWLVHDAQTLPESEIQLLARLIQNFPGANIRAILLMSGQPNALKSPLSAFGRKILRWDIEAPTEDQAQAALDSARHEGHFNAVQQLVQRIQRQQRPRELDTPFQTTSLSAGLPSSQTSQAPVSALKTRVNSLRQRIASLIQAWHQAGQTVRNAPQWIRNNRKLALGISLALVMSTLMMLWIQPEAFGLKSVKPVKPAAATQLTSPQLATALPPTTQEEAPRAQALMAVTPPAFAIEVPEATLSGQAWLKQLDANSFLLQHGTASSYEKVLDIQRKHPGLKDAHIVAAYRPGEKLAHFVIVSGPFSELNQGYEASKRPGIPKSWVRPTRGLQELLKSPN